MSTTQSTGTKARKPQVLELSAVEVEEETHAFAPPVAADAPLPQAPSRAVKWFALFASGLSGLALLGIGLWAENLVRTLVERQPMLGWVALGLLGLAVLGLVGFIAREVRAIMRLRTLDDLREGLQNAYDNEDTNAARKALNDVVSLYKTDPRTAHGRAQFDRSRAGVLDAQDLIVIGEETLMAPLDRQAVALVSTAARRVSLVTALSPRALVDIAMVAFQCVSLTRQIAQAYGAKPGLLGALGLARHMIGHLAITGGIAATEGLVSQVLGHSLAARLSARLGEGVINGLLTARVGLAAIAVTRPMPYIASTGPTLSEVTKGIAGFGGHGKASVEKTD